MSNVLKRISDFWTNWSGDDSNGETLNLTPPELREICSMHVELARMKTQLRQAKTLLESSAEEIENLYGGETNLTETIRNFI